MEKEVLEVVLKKLERESGIASIIDLESVPALPKGENYTSTILRVKLKVVLGNGRLAKKSLIVKQMNTEGEDGEFIKQYNVAAIESKIYSVVLKNMSYLMEEFEDTDETLWCKFILYDPHSSCIVLEDLKASGYCLVPRQEGLDLEHAILVLRSLGRYHGMAKVLEEREIISKNDYAPYRMYTDSKIVKIFVYSSIMNVCRVMKKSWGPAWEETAKKLMISFEPFNAKLKQIIYPEESEFTVLNHGDCWSNNMMFKYDYQKRPIAVKFLDHQCPVYNTPCIDLTHFIYMGIQPTIRRSNYQLLVMTYHDSLVRTLDKFGFSGTKPTLEEINTTMKRLEFLGLSSFVSSYATVTCTSTQAFDFAKILSTEGEEGFSEDMLREPRVMERMGPDIIDFVERYAHELK